MPSERKEWISRTMLALAAGAPLAVDHLFGHAAWPAAAAAGGVTALTWYGDFLTSTKGQAVLERHQYVFRHMVEPFRESLKAHDSTARVNVMYVRRQWNFRRRLVFFDRQDLVAHPDHGLTLGIHQGVAGRAFCAKKWAIGDLESQILHLGTIGNIKADVQTRDVSYGLTDEQQQATRDLKLIFSFPIRKLERVNGKDPEFTDDVIGVVNVDSRFVGAYKFYKSRGLPQQLVGQFLPNLASVCGALLS